ncbi:inositol monophosphatase family protein [candidate division KSB1 bacterium]
MNSTMQFDSWTGFGLTMIAEAIELVNTLGSKGTRVVDVRTGGYRYWDPETLKVDKEVEDFFIKKVKERGIYGTFLSEEVGKIDLTKTDSCPDNLDEKVYFISDPFDGSLLYKRNISAFWYTTLAVYSADGTIKTAIVGDCASRTVDFCDSRGAYTAKIKDLEITDISEIKPAQTSNLSDAFIETYLMKPHYLYPAVFNFQPLLQKVKFVHPNGGPSGFCDVASGRVDVYIANKQPFVDVYTGLAVAQKAGCVLTDYEGNSPEFKPDINMRCNIICSANQSIHKQVLEILKECKLDE